VESVTKQSSWIIIVTIVTGAVLPLGVWGCLFCRSVCDSIEVVSNRKLVALLIVSPNVITAALPMEFIGFNNKGAL
jgi:hypothetical protein